MFEFTIEEDKWGILIMNFWIVKIIYAYTFLIKILMIY